MLKQFLVPLDTSTISEQVIPYVVLLAKRLDQAVHLLTVSDDGELAKAVGPHSQALLKIVDDRRAEVTTYLAAIRARLESEGVTATTEAAVGHTAEQILAVAAAQGSELIVMATHGRVGPERWFVGSVADRVLRSASVPVLLIRPDEQAPSSPSTLERVILPLDGSALAEEAIPYATFLAQAFSVPILLIRSVDLTWLIPGGDGSMSDSGLAPELIDALQDDARRYLAEMVGKLGSGGATVETKLTFERPASEIIDQAHQQPGTLVVMSTHGRSGLSRTVLGSVADRVVRSSNAPVLLVRGISEG